eukprot:jgi/Pico_ML_1/50580/g1765.t1
MRSLLDRRRGRRGPEEACFVDDVDVASEEDDPSVEEDDAHAATDEEDEVRRIASALQRHGNVSEASQDRPGAADAWERAEAFPGDAKAA